MTPRLAPMIAALALFLGATATPLLGHEVQVAVQIVKPDGSPIENPALGVKALDPRLPGWTVDANAGFHFTFQASLANPSLAATSQLVFELRDSRNAGGQVIPNNPHVIGQAAFPLDQPTPGAGQYHQVRFADLLGANPDPNRTYFFGVYVVTSAHGFSVDCRLNGRQAGVSWIPPQTLIPFAFRNFQLYYRTAAQAPAPANLQHPADSPHRMGEAALFQINGRDVIGAISQYAYAFEDMGAQAGIQRRIWRLYRVNNGQTQSELLWSQIVDAPQTRIQFNVPQAAPPQPHPPTHHYRLHCQTVDGYAVPSAPFSLSAAGADVAYFTVGPDISRGGCIRAAWHETLASGGNALNATCNPDGFDNGYLFAAPRIDSDHLYLVQPQDRFQFRLIKANGSVALGSCPNPCWMAYPSNSVNTPDGAQGFLNNAYQLSSGLEQIEADCFHRRHLTSLSARSRR